MATLLGVSADEIALTRNTSEGTNLIVRGIDLKPGDEVIITDHNHPSNHESWKLRARREGLVVRSVPVRCRRGRSRTSSSASSKPSRRERE